MQYSEHIFNEYGVRAQISTYENEGGIKEYHVMLHVSSQGQMFPEQYARLCKAEDEITTLLDNAQPRMKRYFISDAANQAHLMKPETIPTSIIQQAPLDGSKVALWIYLTDGESNYQHRWDMGMHIEEGNSYYQTKYLLESFEANLAKEGGEQPCTIADNCIRTWFFVRDVDIQYSGMVNARKENFAEQGLTEQTHYLSSTGIQGLPLDGHSIIQMDAYSILDIQKSQQKYLYAKSHLNSTYEYGVTFERGTRVEYGDRSHYFISGTASIDNKGNVLHIGDIKQQTIRMWENVEMLLKEGGASLDDIMQIIVYLRDVADYSTVSKMFEEKFPNVPHVITLAPVCRPTWLIEMECIAVNSNHNDEFKAF